MIHFRLHALEPCFDAFVQKCGVDRAVFGKLLMLVVGKACAQFDAVEKPAAGVDFGAQVGPVLLDLEPDLLGFDRRVE